MRDGRLSLLLVQQFKQVVDDVLTRMGNELRVSIGLLSRLC